MRRGTLSLDLILSIVVMLAAATMISSVALFQLEQSQTANYKYKAEAMAMSVGTAINHFYATDPEDGSWLRLKLKHTDPFTNPSSVASGGFLTDLGVSPDSCELIFDSNSVTISMQLTGTHSFFEETVTATYPVVTVQQTSIPCDQEFFVKLVGEDYVVEAGS